MFGITSDIVIIILSALAAAASFAAVVIPMLNRNEKKAHYRDTIEKKKKALFETAKEDLKNPKGSKELSAKDSVATFFKVQQLAGDLGEKVKVNLLQAGIRDPYTVFYYLRRHVFRLLFTASYH
jgi:tight adherence protein C